MLCLFPLFLLYTFFTSCNCTQTVLKVNLNLEATFSINVSTSLEINPKWKNEREQQTLTFCFCLFFLLPCMSHFVYFFLFLPFLPLPSCSDPGFFFRVLGRHQACLLDERRDTLEVFPQAVHLPKGHEF